MQGNGPRQSLSSGFLATSLPGRDPGPRHSFSAGRGRGHETCESRVRTVTSLAVSWSRLYGRNQFSSLWACWRICENLDQGFANDGLWAKSPTICFGEGSLFRSLVLYG